MKYSELAKEVGKGIMFLIAFACIAYIMLVTMGCASPYQPQANALLASYQKGEITPNEFHQRATELESLELQRRAAISGAFNNLSVWGQNQQYLYNQTRPHQQIYLYRGF